MAETIKVHPDCPNGSNLYHECGQYCTPKITEASERKGKKNSGPVLLNAPRSFDKRIKQVPHNICVPKEGFVADDSSSPQLHSKNKAESRKVQPLSVFLCSNDEICVEDDVMPDSPKNPPEANSNPSKQDHSNPNPKTDNPKQNGNHHTGFGTEETDSDDEDMMSMISDSDSRVWVGNHHVKASISSTLQAIIHKHGDIAAACRLQSPALRAYHLECTCHVVQQLRTTTPITNLTKNKLREMIAIVNDVEAAQISVGWLRRVLTEIAERVEPAVLREAVEAAKAAEKALEGRREELGVKEREVENVKRMIAETEGRLAQIEIELSELNKSVETMRSKVENFDFKALLDEVL